MITDPWPDKQAGNNSLMPLLPVCRVADCISCWVPMIVWRQARDQSPLDETSVARQTSQELKCQAAVVISWLACCGQAVASL